MTPVFDPTKPFKASDGYTYENLLALLEGRYERTARNVVIESVRESGRISEESVRAFVEAYDGHEVQAGDPSCSYEEALHQIHQERCWAGYKALAKVEYEARDTCRAKEDDSGATDAAQLASWWEYRARIAHDASHPTHAVSSIPSF